MALTTIRGAELVMVCLFAATSIAAGSLTSFAASPSAGMRPARSRIAVTACDLLIPKDSATALGRPLPAAGRPGRGNTGGASDCRFAGGPKGDVRVLLSGENPSISAKMREEIFTAEGAKFERISDLGHPAYYWDDTILMVVGRRELSIWVTRNTATESADAVKTALRALAKTALDRLPR